MVLIGWEGCQSSLSNYSEYPNVGLRPHWLNCVLTHRLIWAPLPGRPITEGQLKMLPLRFILCGYQNCSAAEKRSYIDSKPLQHANEVERERQTERMGFDPQPICPLPEVCCSGWAGLDGGLFPLIHAHTAVNPQQLGSPSQAKQASVKALTSTFCWPQSG